MKNYRIKNYRGNLVESLTRFAKFHKGMRIVEAVEDEDELKVKAEVEEGCKKIEESDKNIPTTFLVHYAGKMTSNNRRDAEKKKIVSIEDLYKLSKENDGGEMTISFFDGWGTKPKKIPEIVIEIYDD